MVKVAVVAKHPERAGPLLRDLSSHGFEVDRSNPNIVISFGGDGTALRAERLYPGIPRVMIKHSSICARCPDHNYTTLLEALGREEYKVVRQIKVEAVKDDSRVVGLNEINVHHQLPFAVRLSVQVDNEDIAENVICDGVICATPYGSSGYFHSIAGYRFGNGLGVAFIAPTKPIESRVVGDTETIRVYVVRGPGLLLADNDTKMAPLVTGDEVYVRRASEYAQIVEVLGTTKVTV
ncbi:MAG: hypothetical protein ACETVV_02815 [Nitrososphaeria archaeon]